MRNLWIILIMLLGCNICNAEELGKLIKERTEIKEREVKVEKLIEEKVKVLFPEGKQSYGDLKWSCKVDHFIILSAKDVDNKEKISVVIVYHPKMTEQEKKSFNNTCLGLPAIRFPDKWVWVLVGRTELRFGVNDKSLQSDEKLDAIVKSFDLDQIKKL